MAQKNGRQKTGAVAQLERAGLAKPNALLEGRQEATLLFISGFFHLYFVHKGLRI